MSASKKPFFIVEPNQKELTEISRLLDSGELQCFVDAVVPFVRASDAYCGTIVAQRGRGKMVLSIIAAI
jgi:NADPH:quinone reductase-like Zn-dependent oxidoreductase